MNRRQLREYTFKLLFHANFYDKEELNEQADRRRSAAFNREGKGAA